MGAEGNIRLLVFTNREKFKVNFRNIDNAEGDILTKRETKRLGYTQ